MDIPLPEGPEEIEQEEKEDFEQEENEEEVQPTFDNFTSFSEDTLGDIPVPDDSNRYSPSVPNEDDQPEIDDLSSIQLPDSSPKEKSRAPVTGKTVVQKRFLSMLKQTVASKNKNLDQLALRMKESAELKEALKKKKKKKVATDKARDTISEIEEMKRKENELRENMLLMFTGSMDPAESFTKGKSKSGRMGYLAEKLLSKKMRREEREERERREEREERERRRDEREERERKREAEKKEKRRKEKEKEKRERDAATARNWQEFNAAGLSAYHFRRSKARRSNLESPVKQEKERGGRVNLLETAKVLRVPLIVEGASGEDIEFPSWSVRHTKTRPHISYCLNPDYASFAVSREEMMHSLPSNILRIVNQFLSSIKGKSMRVDWYAERICFA